MSFIDFLNEAKIQIPENLEQFLKESKEFYDFVSGLNLGLVFDIHGFTKGKLKTTESLISYYSSYDTTHNLSICHKGKYNKRQDIEESVQEEIIKFAKKFKTFKNPKYDEYKCLKFDIVIDKISDKTEDEQIIDAVESGLEKANAKFKFDAGYFKNSKIIEFKLDKNFDEKSLESILKKIDFNNLSGDIVFSYFLGAKADKIKQAEVKIKNGKADIAKISEVSA